MRVIQKSDDNFIKFNDVESVLIHGDKSKIKQPFITIAIPTYRRHILLKEAIDSALNQLNPNCEYEVIIVDNEVSYGVVTETEKLIKGYSNNKLLYYRNSDNIGMAGNWNRCFELARGKWVAFLHDDDLLVNDYLFKVSKLLDKKKKIGALVSSFEIIGENNRTKKDSKLERVTKKLFVRFGKNKLMRIRPLDTKIWNSNIYGPPTCGALFYKDYALKQGGFDEDNFPSLDWFFLFNFNKKYKVYKPLDKLGFYRVIDNESLNPKTLRAFVKDAADFREINRKSYLIGKLMFKFFKYEQHAVIIDWVMDLGKSSELKAEEFNNLCKYKIRPILLSLYKRAFRIYWIIKRIMAMIFG
ncbi:glycosyltransferase family 2 protein [Robertmurraya kyonggiensis]|nr:glycosyltransferase [Robertmurraya kyonggiensis]